MIELERIDDYRVRIPARGGMRAPGLIYSSPAMARALRKEKSLGKVANVAHLPGIARKVAKRVPLAVIKG